MNRISPLATTVLVTGGLGLAGLARARVGPGQRGPLSVVVNMRMTLTDPHWRLSGVSFHAVDTSPRERVDAASGLRPGRHWGRVHIADLDALPPPAGASKPQGRQNRAPETARDRSGGWRAIRTSPSPEARNALRRPIWAEFDRASGRYGFAVLRRSQQILTTW
jgi:hypothetical protein